MSIITWLEEEWSTVKTTMETSLYGGMASFVFFQMLQRFGIKSASFHIRGTDDVYGHMCRKYDLTDKWTSNQRRAWDVATGVMVDKIRYLNG